MRTRSGISQPVVTNPGGGMTEREIHLRNASKLFKPTEPPLLLKRFDILPKTRQYVETPGTY